MYKKRRNCKQVLDQKGRSSFGLRPFAVLLGLYTNLMKNAASYVAAVIPQYQNGHFTTPFSVAILMVKIRIIVLYLTVNNGG